MIEQVANFVATYYVFFSSILPIFLVIEKIGRPSFVALRSWKLILCVNGILALFLTAGFIMQNQDFYIT